MRPQGTRGLFAGPTIGNQSQRFVAANQIEKAQSIYDAGAATFSLEKGVMLVITDIEFIGGLDDFNLLSCPERFSLRMLTPKCPRGIQTPRVFLLRAPLG
jgi:hypothetical protein